MRLTRHALFSFAALSLCVGVYPALADEGAAPADEAAESTAAAANADGDTLTVDADDTKAGRDEASAREVMDQLLEQRRESPTIEPIREPQVNPEASRVGAPAVTVDLDPAVVGVAPGAEAPALLPEGTFIVNRRGRVIRSQDGAHVMFVFEADGAESPEAPMILQRCRKLEDMEDYVEKHGDQTVFRLSGQVHTYRNANYLLPTMMVVDIDRGNLES